MEKDTAISIFGSGANLGRALNKTRQAICRWPNDLCQWQIDQVIGAAIRLNKLTPEKAKELIEHERERNQRTAGADQ